MPKKVLVVMGGFSAEREVSLISGKGIVEALNNSGYEVIGYDLRNGFDFVEILKKEKPDVVFNALHGNFGEDGEIQGLLDILQIPYTHSGLRASALGMDKVLTKEVARASGLKVAQSEQMTYKEYKQTGTHIKMPYVIKPVSDGSSVGVFIIKKEEDKKAIFYENDNREVMIEEFIEGQELTVSVLNGKALAVTEMRSKTAFYDYEAKYTDGMTQHILPAEISQEVYRQALKDAEILHSALHCHTVSRCDFRYNPKDGIVLLEINTNPGMTPLSLVPEQAKYVGISYEKVCQTLVESATYRKIES
ncbi:MAG: D-alanine--D-alanine ligase [Alphaproteobacteria bacterium]|nr:D-alanine--D-alanine ligase [Alphaproteobacteria bacterium]